MGDDKKTRTIALHPSRVEVPKEVANLLIAHQEAGATLDVTVPVRLDEHRSYYVVFPIRLELVP